MVGRPLGRRQAEVVDQEPGLPKGPQAGVDPAGAVEGEPADPGMAVEMAARGTGRERPPVDHRATEKRHPLRCQGSSDPPITCWPSSRARRDRTTGYDAEIAVKRDG